MLVVHCSGHDATDSEPSHGCPPALCLLPATQAAQLFAHHGARVVVSDLDAAAAQATVDFITNSCGTAISVPGDVTDPTLPVRLVEAAVSAFSGIDILVNNAGARECLVPGWLPAHGLGNREALSHPPSLLACLAWCGHS